MSEIKLIEKLKFADWTRSVPESEIRRLLKYKVKYFEVYLVFDNIG